jgi:condensin complex subunit 1
MNETRSLLPDVNQDPNDPFSFDYDSYAQLLEKTNQPTDPRVINKAWTILIKTTENFRESLREIFSVLNDSVGSQIFETSSSQGNRVNFFESIDERLRYLSTLKSITSLNCKFVQYFEDALSAKGSDDSFTDGRSRKKQKVNHDIPHKEYERHKERIMRNLLQLIVIPLNKVADSPTEAKDIVGNVMRVAYKMIENSSVNNLKSNKDLYDIVLSIVGFGIEKYNQSLSFCLKLIQILQYKEQLAAMMAEVVEFIVTRHNQRLLISEVMREIDRIDIRELSKDSSCPKAVSAFLITLSERCPQEFIPSLNHIFGYLEQDSYIMRNASLTVMANLHIKYLKDNESEKGLRDEILDTMLAHIRDSTGYTRSRALGTWSMICENECFPLTHVVPVTKAAVNRLSDKSCFVRRSAAKFLVNILCRNPYYKKLPIKVFMEKYQQEKAVYEKLLAEEKEKLARDEEIVETLSQHSTQDGSITSETDPETVHPNLSVKTLVQPEESPVEAQKRTLAFYQAALEFIKEIHRSIPLMIELLTSKNTTDIQEAIDFFVICHERGIDEALLGFKRMILLVSVTEKSIKDTILAAYRKIFFNPDLKDARIVANLLNFIQSASIAECLSLEILIGQFVANGDFTKSMERELFATFTKKRPNTTNEESIAAIQLIGMLAATQPEIVHHNLQVCVQYGLAVVNYDEQECRLARETCIAIKKSLPKKIEDRQKRPLRLARDDELFVKLENILVESLHHMGFEHWFSFCDEALKIIFEMAENADKICESIYNRLSNELLKNSVQCNSTSTQENTNRNESPDFVFQPSAAANTNGTTASSQSTQSANMEMVHPIALARFIHFIGDAALNLAVFLELHVLLEIKIRNALSNNDAANNTTNHNITVNNISVSSRRRSKRFGGNKSVDDQNLEEEIGLAGAEAEDMEMEFIGSICDEELVCGNNLLAKAARLIIEIVTDPSRYPQRELKLASALALAKFMMVSVKFCNNYLRLLFTILERTTDSEVKINLLVAISDLCVRFPNQLDGWTSKIFECLKSEDTLVRRSALKIISRLVLCDVMKAKEQISAIANLIVDDDEQIAHYSRHFFLELSKKLNAIYNVLPDIISRLSSGASEANFRIVMRFIFELIDKSHHVERLIDKLCTRFQETDNERHWADLAYCLSLLKHSDKSMCKLIDRYDCYKDKLCVDSVRESITVTVSNYKKNPGLKNEMKQMLDEFEKKLVQSTGNENEEQQQDGDDRGADGNDETIANGDVEMEVQEDE